MRRTTSLALALALLSGALGAGLTVLPAAEATVPATTTPTTWTTASFRSVLPAWRSYSLTEIKDEPDFGGHPLDTVFDSSGAVWTLGEFSMQITRGAGGSFTRVNVPLKTYANAAGTLAGWTQPFASSWGGRSSSTELAESIVRAGSTSVWASLGGQFEKNPVAGNHSMLVRVSTTAPYATCAVPLPGDNNQLMGLAYDSVRDRIWFVESNGDNLTAGDYATLGWVKAAGLGSNCKNGLDYGGDPGKTTAQNNALRASAQTAINALQCDAGQGATANCVHIVTHKLQIGAAHLVYDAGLDALWISNYATSGLQKYAIASGALTTYDGPAGTVAWPPGPTWWKVAVRSDAVFLNEYEGNRILRFDKSSLTWSLIEVPVAALNGANGDVETHSIARSGKWLWFTVSNEKFPWEANSGQTALGRIDLDSWATGQATATLYTGFSGWEILPTLNPEGYPKQNSLRGLDIDANGRIAVTNAGDLETLLLTP